MKAPRRGRRFVLAVTLLVLASFIRSPLGPGPALHAQEVIELTHRDQRIEAGFEELFRVGVLDGEPWEMFGRVNQVAFDAEGRLYIFDGTIDLMGAGDLRILVFDRAGVFLHEFGSSGGGPGEFNRPTAFAVLRDGTTVVHDAGHRAYQLFDRSGAFLRMVRTGADSRVSARSGSLLPDPRGGAVLAGDFGGNFRVSMGSAGGAAATPPTMRPIVRVELDGEVIQADTIVRGWLPARDALNEVAPNNMPAELQELLGGMSIPTVFEPLLLAGPLPGGGIVHSDSSAWSLKVTPAGEREPATVIRRPFAPEPVTPAVLSDYQEKRAAAGRGRGAGPVMLQMRGRRDGNNPAFSQTVEIQERYYPEIPVLRALAATWEGRIWVQRRGDEPDRAGPIDVVTAQGDYIGSYAATATAMPDAFGPGGRAAFIELDDYDVARVVVRRLPGEVR